MESARYTSLTLRLRRILLAGSSVGVGVAIITAITGTAVFIAAATSQNVSVLYLVGSITIAAAVVGAIHTQLQLPALATEHTTAAREYGVLRKEFEANLNCTPAEEICPLLHATRAKWTGIEAKYRFVFRTADIAGHSNW